MIVELSAKVRCDECQEVVLFTISPPPPDLVNLSRSLPEGWVARPQPCSSAVNHVCPRCRGASARLSPLRRSP